MNLAEQEKTVVLDVDGSYTYRKYVALIEVGQQVLMPPDPAPPLDGWKQIREASWKDLSGCFPHVTYGKKTITMCGAFILALP